MLIVRLVSTLNLLWKLKMLKVVKECVYFVLVSAELYLFCDLTTYFDVFLC